MKRIIWEETTPPQSKDIMQMVEIYDWHDTRILLDYEKNILYKYSQLFYSDSGGWYKGVLNDNP